MISIVSRLSYCKSISISTFLLNMQKVDIFTYCKKVRIFTYINSISVILNDEYWIYEVKISVISNDGYWIYVVKYSHFFF